MSDVLLFQRGGENRGFHKLPTPYSPTRLKDIAGQANIYIRPLQKNITALPEQNVQVKELRCVLYILIVLNPTLFDQYNWCQSVN